MVSLSTKLILFVNSLKFVSILHAVKCGYPLDLLVNNFTSVSGYSDPTLVGATVNISCPLGNVIQESNTTVTTCMENGKWELNPSQERIRCRGIASIHNTLYNNYKLNASCISYMYMKKLINVSIII